MKVFFSIVLAWFLITLLILPHFGEWDYDIWTTNDYDDIVDALETPVFFLKGLGEVAKDVEEGWGKVTENETVQTAWEIFTYFSPIYWIYNWVGDWFGGAS